MALRFQIRPIDLAVAWRGQSIAVDFLRNFSAVAEFFPYPPDLEESLDVALAARGGVIHPSLRRAVVAALWAYNQPLGAGEATQRHLAALEEDNTFAIVTGQQPGLWTGPLYTIYKALTAVVLSERLSSERSERFVPVFWIATEDEDFEEVCRAWYVSQRNELQCVAWPPLAGQENCSVGPLPLAVSLTPLLEQWAEGLPETEFRGAVFDLLTRTYEPSRTFGEWFARLLTELFRDLGLILWDPMWPPLRALMAPVFRQAIEQPLAFTRAANRAGEQLEAAGYHPSLHKPPDQCSFYVYRGGRRERVFYDEATARFRIADEAVSSEELLAHLDAAPEDFSASLMLRPLTQDALLPTGIFLGGPGEVSYFAQLRGLYDRLALPMPLLLPRLGATLIEPKVARLLAKYGLAPEDFWDDFGALTSRVVAETEGGETATLFQEARRQIGVLWPRLETHVAAIDESLRRTAEQARHRVLTELNRLEEKAQRARKRQNETLQAQLQTIRTHLAPRGNLQERTLNLLPYLLKFGPDFVAQLAVAFRDLEIGQHAFLTLETT